jgi:hypothetical protein
MVELFETECLLSCVNFWHCGHNISFGLLKVSLACNCAVVSIRWVSTVSKKFAILNKDHPLKVIHTPDLQLCPILLGLRLPGSINAMPASVANLP